MCMYFTIRSESVTHKREREVFNILRVGEGYVVCRFKFGMAAVNEWSDM